MKKLIAITIAALISLVSASAFANTYEMDPAHTSVLFRVKHADLAYVYGMFLKKEAVVTYDPENVESASVKWTVQADSVFTNVKKRDDHLRSPDFLDAKQFPTIKFESTKVEKAGDSLRVTGNLTLHGVTKQITTLVEITGTGESKEGNPKIGMFTSFNVKRSDFGIKAMMGAASDRIYMIITFEGEASKE